MAGFDPNHVQHYWARHDSRISRTVLPYKDRLETLRGCNAERLDLKTLHKTILKFLRDMMSWPSTRGEAQCHWLSRCLFLCGPDYYGYAAVFSEQNILRTNPMLHSRTIFSRCDLCSRGLIISGPRFPCLVCIDIEFCAACYSGWESSMGDKKICEGHSFYEILRPCWYSFKEGIVTEDGLTLEDVIKLLEKKFTALEQVNS
jgi:hypothetical protein